jgi:hypothetical protein
MHPGKLPAIRLPDIFIISMEGRLFSIFLLPLLEDRSRIITFSWLRIFGTGMLQMEKLVGIQAR